MKSTKKQSDSISNYINERKPMTSEQRELLAKYHNAIRDIPSTEELIKVFGVSISKQRIFKIAEKKRNGK